VLGQRREMRQQAGLARLIVIGHHHQGRIGADIGGGADHVERCRCRIISAAGNDRHAPSDHLDHSRDHVPMLVAGQGRDFAGRAAWHQGVRALGNLPVDELAQCVFGDTAIREWRHQRRD